jgi:tetratricopeptide (TPR) repeat protein
MNKDEILQSIKNGYKEFSYGRTREAADIWLPAWKDAQNLLIQGNYKTQKEILDLFGDIFLNWFFDLDIALMESDMHSERLDFNRYVLTISDYMDQDNPRMNVAESLASLNRYEEAESTLSKWLEEDSLWAGGWTCWANILLDNDDDEKAREIMERGMTTLEDSPKDVDFQFFYQNAEAVYKRIGATDRAAYCANKFRELALKAKAVSESSKVGRNDPCTCGSGKKYKKCCGR